MKNKAIIWSLLFLVLIELFVDFEIELGITDKFFVLYFPSGIEE